MNGEKDEEAVKLWAENGAEKYRKALHEGIQENINMVKYDFLINVCDSSEFLEVQV